MRVKGIVFSLATAAMMLGPSLAFGDVSGSVYLFDWTYGNPALATNPTPATNTDSVYAYGTLEAEYTGAGGIYDILSGSGTRIDATGTASAGTYSVSIVGFNATNLINAQSYLGEPCLYSLASNCNVVDAGAGGASANLEFDNVLYADGAPGYQLDADGIVLFEANAPCCKPGTEIPLATSYYSVWGQGYAGPVPPDQEFDPYQYDGRNLINQFTVTEVGSVPLVGASIETAPEPGFYGFLALGLAGLIAMVRHRKLA